MENKQLNNLIKTIKKDLSDLESLFWNTHVGRYEYFDPSEDVNDFDFEHEDNKTWLYYGTKRLYYKICLLLELKNLPIYLKTFKSKFENIIENEELATKSRGPLYYELEPSMIIHDDFRDFLSVFEEFDYNYTDKIKHNKLKLILENTNQLIIKTKSKITNEASIYKLVKWFVEIVYPSSRGLNKARFISQFKTYHPDILIPEISSAIEYKYVKKNESLGNYIDQLKTDVDSYKDDPEYRFFYAVIVFEDKAELKKASIEQAVSEKKFPINWDIIAL